MKTLKIKLAGPLQSYGVQASFNERTTQAYPTKSAILGMIGAALGYRRDDARNKKLNNLDFAVRIDQPGVITTDFQNVEYAPSKRKVTHRQYIQDAVFLVAIASEDDELIEKIRYALYHPIFQLFLGRRANTIAGYLETEIKEGDPISVLQNTSWEASNWYQLKRKYEKIINLPIYADSKLLKDRTVDLIKDHIKTFNQLHMAHLYRPISQTKAEVENSNYEAAPDWFNLI